MPLVTVHRSKGNTALTIDCCDARYDLRRQLEGCRLRFFLLDNQTGELIGLRESKSELDTLIRLHHPTRTVY